MPLLMKPTCPACGRRDRVRLSLGGSGLPRIILGTLAGLTTSTGLVCVRWRCSHDGTVFLAHGDEPDRRTPPTPRRTRD
ncbi:MAG: hypothetical protein AAF995_00210 [Planctomycetota bacterium]